MIKMGEIAAIWSERYFIIFSWYKTEKLKTATKYYHK